MGIGLLVTRLRTPKNVEVTIPNAMVLGSYIVNYSATAREAGVTLANLDRLLSSVAEGLDECVCFEGAVAKIREAVEHLADARMLLASTRS